MGINKKTSLDGRHKILAEMLDKAGKDGFMGITESDKTFFFRLEKRMDLNDLKYGKRLGNPVKKLSSMVKFW